MKIIGNIRKTIEERGSISMAQFMAEAMYDSNKGYYINNNPIGKNGDFITAPEISQLFGEMLGIYCADSWMKLGKPDKFNLVELGPGRATLMSDLLRATKHIPGFHQACSIHLMDTNKHLINIQKERLSSYDIKCMWHNNIYSIPKDDPLIIIANEFFDCLPINQYIKIIDYWYEQSVGLKNQEFYLIHTAMSKIFSDTFNKEYPKAKDRAIIEISREGEKIIQYLSSLLKDTPGYLLMIDYGYDYKPLKRTAFGGSLQAIKDHKYHPIFSDVGNADLTSHVDFYALKKAAKVYDVQAFGSVEQGKFLKELGIQTRANLLKKNATPPQIEEINISLRRLIDSDQMGKLFKAVSIVSKDLARPVGFSMKKNLSTIYHST